MKTRLVRWSLTLQDIVAAVPFSKREKGDTNKQESRSINKGRRLDTTSKQPQRVESALIGGSLGVAVQFGSFHAAIEIL